jgi:hypothetical protein
MLDLAEVSHHMTPKILESELHALDPQCPIFIVNIKPMYRDAVVRELSELMIHDLSIMNVGQAYFW